jgi:hypothetical protein
VAALEEGTVSTGAVSVPDPGSATAAAGDCDPAGVDPSGVAAETDAASVAAWPEIGP